MCKIEIEKEKILSKYICQHCKGDIRIANPSGFCNHVYYPECCDICNGANLRRERIRNVALELLEV